jgi:hypothetical protein
LQAWSGEPEQIVGKTNRAIPRPEIDAHQTPWLVVAVRRGALVLAELELPSKSDSRCSPSLVAPGEKAR